MKKVMSITIFLIGFMFTTNVFAGATSAMLIKEILVRNNHIDNGAVAHAIQVTLEDNTGWIIGDASTSAGRVIYAQALNAFNNGQKVKVVFGTGAGCGLIVVKE